MTARTQTPDPWPKAEHRVLVIVPSRDRPKELAQLIHSAVETSKRADIAVYIDQDQMDLYGFLKDAPDRVKVYSGGRIGPVAVANKVAALSSRYDAFGFVPDDARFTIPGWDDHVLMDCVGSLCIVAPEHGNHEIDMPFISRKWYEALGWFAWPGLYHWGWPSVLAALGHATDSLVRSTAAEFYIDHAGENSKNRDRYPADIINLYSFFASGAFEESLKKLKAAQ